MTVPNRSIDARLGTLLADDAQLPEPLRKLVIRGLAIDSREVEPDFLFAAFAGSAQHGITFAPQAEKRGAVVVLTDRQAPAGTITCPLVRVDDPRRTLARAAARFYGAQPAAVIAVTGTNGKTSVASFTRQLWQTAGLPAASLGTIGLHAPGRSFKGSLTTPDAVSLHKLLAELAAEGVQHLALEASSHGLEQRRLDGIAFAAGAFTNFSRDHLDYHGTMEAYFGAKMRLFEALMPAGAPVVIDADGDRADEVETRALEAGLQPLTVGERGRFLRLTGLSSAEEGTELNFELDGRTYSVSLPLVGRFQVANVLVAAGLAIATGVEADLVVEAMERLQGAEGRLEKIGRTPHGATVYVDYAHTPDAVATALRALRDHTSGRLLVVLGAGGDRDPGKRPLMGEAASRWSDQVIVTDDNPRSEDPGDIRKAVLSGAPGAQEIGDRRAAIRAGVDQLRAGDALLIAGKGHETGQEIAGRIMPFSDRDEAREALRPLGEDA